MAMVLTSTALIGSALVAGIFFTFSNFVMAALEDLPYRAGISAMQSINSVVLNPLFLGLFFGVAVLVLALAALPLLDWEQSYSLLILSGAGCYFIGTFIVTIAGNVPLNKKLEHVSVEDTTAAEAWSEYLIKWNRWNNLRTLSALISTILFTFGLVQMIGE